MCMQIKEVFIGDTIHHGRLDRGETQEATCAGVCDTATLSRIVTGKQAPSRKKAKGLLHRVGQPDDRYYMYLTADEAEAETLWANIDRSAAQFRQSLGEEKRQARRDTLEYLSRLEAIMDAEDHITRQDILARRAVLGTEDGPYDLEVKRDMLLEAIRLTVPQFDPERLKRRLYSIDEMEIIGEIVQTYSEAGDHEKAAGIFYQLLTNVRQHHQNVTYPSRNLSPAALYYARELCLMGRYEEALETAEMGWQACLDYGYCRPLPGLLTVMAECRYAMGEQEQSRNLYCQAYCVLMATGDASGLEQVKEEGRRRFGPVFPWQEVSG